MLSAFLRNLHITLKSSPLSKYVIVTGNEACDLDSIACATSYAYIKAKEDPTSSIAYIPYCNILKSDIDLRTEAIYWLKKCHINKDDLFYVGSLDWLLVPGSAKEVAIILVDHLHSEPSNIFKDCPIVEIIDHHPIPQDYEKPETCNFFLIEKVGSCSSLIVHELFNRLSEELIPTDLCHFLYGAILIDTDGLSQQALELKRAVRKDLDAARKLEAFAAMTLLTEGSSRTTVYKAIMEAKFCITGLSLWDLLRRDCKKVTLGSENQPGIVCSTITGMDFQELIARDDFRKEAIRFCVEQCARVLVCVTVGSAPLDAFDCPHADCNDASLSKDVRRGIVITGPMEYRDMVARLWTYLIANSEELRLEERPSVDKCTSVGGVSEVERDVYVALVTNKAATRKQLVPILVDFLRSQG